nr:MAG TPA: hypothetical protein [Caudoviricetes sp.]
MVVGSNPTGATKFFNELQKNSLSDTSARIPIGYRS